jgi:hypothetical protein
MILFKDVTKPKVESKLFSQSEIYICWWDCYPCR